MDLIELKRALLELTESERKALIKEIELSSSGYTQVLSLRRSRLDSKQGKCPHCGSFKYSKFGVDKGSKRYRCKECKRTFTEYTGTWLSRIHKKSLVDDYLKLMKAEMSLDNIKEELGINKKTAFDWRHKILSGVETSGKGSFKGITESDDTFFLLSEKGKKQTERTPRKRGSKARRKGINNEQVAVIVTADRHTEIDLTVACRGRIKKSDIENAIGDRLSDQMILCSDSHNSYKGFAIDKKIEHHAVRLNQKQRVKNKIYHIQHVNSIDSRLKMWIIFKFHGVSTKYLQKYMNWFRSKEMLKDSENYTKDFTSLSLESLTAWSTFKAIPKDFEVLLHSSTHN